MALQSEIANYNAVAQRIQDTRAEVSQVETQIAQADTQLAYTRSELSTRAAAMYRGDQVGMLEVLLGTHSLKQLFMWADYMVRANDYDSQLLAEIQQQRSQNEYLRGMLDSHEQQLQAELDSADGQRVQILELIASQQQQIRQLGGEAARLAAAMNAPASIPAGATDAKDPGKFSWNTLISEATYRNSSAMSATDIQTFLNGEGGPLKNYRAPDHNGHTMSAAQMISDAASANGVSPKVIIATLQKEQSLIEKQPSSNTAFDWAMGCGKTDSVTYTKYRGFGQQVWWGAYKLAHDGDMWHRGISLDIDGTKVYPTNPATLSLYRYTPHQSGAMSFYTLYERYFGNPNL